MFHFDPGVTMGPEETQQFCLRWHNYQNTLLATLPQLLNGNDLTDVTLCAGGRNVNAHKVVLSVCSQYFKDLFKVNIAGPGSLKFWWYHWGVALTTLHRLKK